MKQTNEAQTNPESNSKTNFWVILLSIVITTLIVGLGIYFILNATSQKILSQYDSTIQGLNNQLIQSKQIQSDLNKQVIGLQGQIEAISSIQKEEPTTTKPELNLNDWPIYTNEKYGYTFNYPKINFYNLSSVESSPENVQFDTEGPGSGLSVEVSNNSLEEAIKELPEQWARQNTKEFNSNTFTIFYHNGSEMVPGDWYKALIENNSKTIDITLHRSGNEKLFNQILDTFVFEN